MKGRSSKTYENKKLRIVKWYDYIKKHRQLKDGLGRDKKPLKPLEFFLAKLKQPNKNKES